MKCQCGLGSVCGKPGGHSTEHKQCQLPVALPTERVEEKKRLRGTGENKCVECIDRMYANIDPIVDSSSSGKSPNILNAIQHALNSKTPVLAIFGMDGNVDDFYWADGDNTFIHIDSHNYGIIELTTEIILHSMVEELVDELG